MSNQVFERRTLNEKTQVGDYFNGPSRYYDQVNENVVVKVLSGDCVVNEAPGELMMTILGSCIACCMHDPILKVGGMNHFLVPGDINSTNESGRFGANAMEMLINKLIKKGALKSRLEVKIFGGANLLDNSQQIGAKNISFVKEFLKREGMKIVGEDVGGETPRRLHFYPDSGKAMLRKLQRQEDLKIVQEEKEYITKVKSIIEKPKDDDVTLF